MDRLVCSYLFNVWLTIDDKGVPSARRVLFASTTDANEAIRMARNIKGTITEHIEYTANQYLAIMEESENVH